MIAFIAHIIIQELERFRTSGFARAFLEYISSVMHRGNCLFRTLTISIVITQ